MFICRSSFDLIFPTHRSWLLSLCVHPPAQRIADAIKRICYWGDYRVWVYSSRSANPLPSAFRAKTYSTALSLHSCVRLLVAEMARGFALCNFPVLLQLFSALQIRDSSDLVNNSSPPNCTGGSPRCGLFCTFISEYLGDRVHLVIPGRFLNTPSR